jgi:hypothetical protein
MCGSVDGLPVAEIVGRVYDKRQWVKATSLTSSGRQEKDRGARSTRAGGNRSAETSTVVCGVRRAREDTSKLQRTTRKTV